MASKIIQQLVSIPGLKIECPNCGEDFSIKKAKLFNMYEKYPAPIQKMIVERLASADEMKEDINMRKQLLIVHKKKKPEKITVSAQASNFGQVSEQILPAFLTFPYKQSECRVLLKPIDYIFFKGLSVKGRVEAIKFIDVKTGGGSLTPKQRQIRDRVTDGKIKHRVVK